MIRISGYNGEPDDAEVRVTVLNAVGVNGDGGTPRDDGTDVWTIDSDSLLGRASSGTEKDHTATLVEKGANVWGLFGWVRPLAGSLVVGLGSEATQALEVLAARWPQDTDPFLRFIREGSNT